jgi:hypothetical protein
MAALTGIDAVVGASACESRASIVSMKARVAFPAEDDTPPGQPCSTPTEVLVARGAARARRSPPLTGDAHTCLPRAWGLLTLGVVKPGVELVERCERSRDARSGPENGLDNSSRTIRNFSRRAPVLRVETRR